MYTPLLIIISYLFLRINNFFVQFHIRSLPTTHPPPSPPPPNIEGVVNDVYLSLIF